MYQQFAQRSLPWYQGDEYLNGLAQGGSNSSALAMDLLQSCAKPSIWHVTYFVTL